MKHNTGKTLIQSRRLIVSVSMFSRLPIVNKAEIIRSFEINMFKMRMRSNHTRSEIQLFIFPAVERLSIAEERSICTNDAIKF